MLQIDFTNNSPKITYKQIIIVLYIGIIQKMGKLCIKEMRMDGSNIGILYC